MASAAPQSSFLRSNGLTGVLLMSFGTAATLEDVPAYLASVRGGRPVPDDLVAEFKRRFARVGGSPLTQITLEQAAALGQVLNAETPGEAGYRVAVGMRHAPPLIAEGMADLSEAGVRRVVAVVMSPQYSPIIMGGYLRALESAREALVASAVGAVGGAKANGIALTVAGPWHDEPLFIAAMAQRVREMLEDLGPEGGAIPIFFTAHSLPRSVADQEPAYIAQLHDTASAIADTAGLPSAQWRFAYQSAGHTPEPWLTPDVKDLLPELALEGHRTVLIAPVQFLADHLEVLYDIDVAAQEEAAKQGIRLVRTASLNTMPTFIRALAAVVRRAA